MKKMNKWVTLVIRKDLEKECKKMKISIPVFVHMDMTDPKNEKTVMGAMARADVDETTGIVNWVKSKGEIHVNNYELLKLQCKLGFLVDNESIKYDVTLCVIRHELFHVWQHENNYYARMHRNDRRIEESADEWMMDMARNRREKLVSEYIHTLHFKKKGYRKEIKRLEKELKEAYKPITGLIYKFV